jgi:MFS family permease
MRRAPFRRLWLAAAWAGLGQWTLQVALFYVVLRLHGAADLAWVVLAGNVPSLLLGPLAGAAVDRWEPGRAARLATSLRVAAVVAVALLAGSALAALALAYAVYGLSGAVASAARQRLLSSVVPEGARGAANARIGAVTGIVTVAGAALGGATALLGPAAVLAAAAAMQALGAAALLGVRGPVDLAQTTVARLPYVQMLRDGLGALRGLRRATSVMVAGVA